MKQAAELVFIPAIGIGHLASSFEIAKLLAARDDRLFITVLTMKLPLESNFKLKGADDAERIRFINLPEEAVETKGINLFLKLFVENHKQHVRDAVAKLTSEPPQSDCKPRLVGFVIDMFCTTMIDVANEFGVPTYVFFTSGAGFLGLVLHLQTLHDEQNKDCTELKESDPDLVLPCLVNPMPARVLPGVYLDKDGATEFINHARRFRETKGILVNTFMELESHCLRALSDGKTPPLYPVGPVLNLKSEPEGSELAKKKEILEWLDDQSPLSVVFLCFGSMGCFGGDQVKEIATALEHSGLRFLWSLRQPLPKGELLFATPQVAVLGHPSVGGFVSHCGWNSNLESLWYGVPVAAWPVYAEQQLNAFELVRELGLAVEIKMDYRREGEVVVRAEEIERGIREVMEVESEQRKKVKEMSEKSRRALMDGGSSHSSLGRFIDQIFL
ncbi:UDP-glucose flavonoid 3-O-glucosyltransferase 6-like [Pyrus ussuriensis x Pyrus communis]|uniref:UDP-glucose:chalcone 2'-O-glucosyltransferase n=1 Tax=Pyrus ussuriensis x Pyrus communis TaxID=2448454 RepID=A0A5N5GE35_9ROSA|nr:UDP-glucose flavonoid 3-O-glucosyltransferase 6-like [Pyrus ussuriensis x Pyrus communis]